MIAKVLIVDDEPTICQGLVQTIPWAEMGAGEVREAYDGEQALQLMKEFPADLIVTDVRMPRMDGLELVEALHDSGFIGKIVMLSGYEEFAYVKKALQFGVKDYLLKPMDVDELIQLLRRLLAELNEEAKRKCSEAMEAFYRSIVKEMLENTEERYDSFPPTTLCRITVSRIKDYYRWVSDASESEQHRIRAEWKDRLTGVFRLAEAPSVSLFLQPNLLLTIVPEQEGILPTVETVDQMMGVCFGQEPVQGHRIEWLVSYEAVPLSGIKLTVEQLNQLLQQGVFGASALTPNEEPASGSITEYPKEIEQKLLEGLFQQKEEETRLSVQQLFGHFRQLGYTLHEAYSVLQEMVMMVERRFRATSGLKHLSHRLTGLKEVDLRVYNSFSALEYLLGKAITNVLELLKQANYGRNRWIIERVTGYIRDNYAQELKSSEIAVMLRITPNYFSSIFKQETGKSFHEYVNEVRVEKAKELLSDTSELVGTIALAVGYKEYKYFSNIFKKHSGFVPSEYRDIQQRSDPLCNPMTARRKCACLIDYED